MTSHPHSFRSDRSLEDCNHDVTGWDAVGKGDEPSWYPKLPAAAHRRRHRTTAWHTIHSPFLVTMLCFAMATGLLLAALPPVCVAGPIPTHETAAIQNLKALAAAQAQYRKKTDAYAGSGWALKANGTLIASDLKNAFEDFQWNGDRVQPVPKAGYLYRMLQSDVAGDPVAWRQDARDSAAGMMHWAVIGRAAEPGVTGERQFLIGEDGVIYTRAEPEKGTPQFNTFWLSDLSGMTNDIGLLDPQKLAAQGWSTAK